ncbi:hypothetical protein RIF25_06935 [Thermosynechococcaceae cyanobacterium BACA0444]|uniref:Uncharacterized protein n=1 Tax=Pseudocalidococcus azoricus BACA0444 TaxID=2918990 RepID=A0AAE4FRR7_9CYAN|nr:hypothetical protein [Pseudocalidococcus azoricus]MDS3860543.1 hypothetical protein [Pseudocalidococcus azoricus BACA0444]
MPITSQLCQLIFDYYRESPTDLLQLQPLMHCQISRAWGTLRINCPDASTLARVKQIFPLWQDPLSLLRVSKKVKLQVNGQLDSILPLNGLPLTKNL